MPATTPNTRDFITVVSGLPRSGTSLMMQMLGAGGIPPLTDELREADPDNPRGYYEYEPVKKLGADRSWLPGAVGRAVKVIHMLITELPDDYQYRVLFMQRDLGETLASQKKMLERSGKRGAAMSDEKLAEVFQHQVDQAKTWLARRRHFQVMDVHYAKLVADPAPHTQQIGAFLGGGLNTAAMANVVDPSLYRQRR